MEFAIPALVSLVGGAAVGQLNKPDTSGQDAAIKKAKDEQSIALDRQKQEQQAAAQDQAVQSGGITRQPRGRRLLQAATGDSGVQSTLG